MENSATGQPGPTGQTSPTTRCLSSADFVAPNDDRYFEDYQIGSVYTYGWAELSEPEIIEFAKRFDPQAMHIDPAAAAAGPTKGIIASGMHTASLGVRMLAEHYLSKVATLPSPGINAMKFTIPVRPGDRLALRTTIDKARPSQSRPDLGVVTTSTAMIKPDESAVLEMTFVHLFRRRSA